MPVPTIPVLHLPVAIGQYPDKGIGVYSRVSSDALAGTGKVKLAEKTNALEARLRVSAPDRRYLLPVQGVEKGTFARKRKHLLASIELAVQENAILVAWDLTRFIRALAYHPHKNPRAWPTRQEFAQLRDLSQGVVLATYVDPLMPEYGKGGRYSQSIARTHKCGKKSQIQPGQVRPILYALQLDETASLQSVATAFGVSKRAVQLLWAHWGVKVYANPVRAYDEARRLGHLDTSKTRKVIWNQTVT